MLRRAAERLSKGPPDGAVFIHFIAPGAAPSVAVFAATAAAAAEATHARFKTFGAGRCDAILRGVTAVPRRSRGPVQTFANGLKPGFDLKTSMINGIPSEFHCGSWHRPVGQSHVATSHPFLRVKFP